MKKKTANELLGAFVDLALAHHHGMTRVDTGHGNQGMALTAWWECHYCKAKAGTPPGVRHLHNCLVVQAQEYLSEL